MKLFADLGLSQEFLGSVEIMGFVEPTPIQEAAIPPLLEGRDLIGQAQTGTGKTAAFMLPLLQRLDRSSGSVKALVLAPTRELAKQVTDAGKALAQTTKFKIVSVYGGQSYTIQLRALERGADVVVGTPGRLLDLIRQKHLDLSHVSMLIIDEADEMLAMGFIEDVESILNELSEQRQVALFSATMPERIRKLSERYLVNPVKIAINPKSITVAEIEQRVYRVREEAKLAALTRILEIEDVNSALVFTRTKARAQDLAEDLLRIGFTADALHGDLQQNRREVVLDRFRSGSVKIMVATDVAARGLDISDVSHVINYDIPADNDDYVHRIGRTGRAGKTGIAISFISPRERHWVNQVQSFTRQPLREANLPSVGEVEAKRTERLIDRITGQLLAGANSTEREMITRLVDRGFDPAAIAIGAIRLLRANDGEINVKEIEPSKSEKTSKRETRSRSDKPTQGWPKSNNGHDKKNKNNKRSSEDGMVRLWMNLGNTNGIRPGDVVGAIAGESGIPGNAIGAIDIRSDHTFVDVMEQHVSVVLSSCAKKYRLRGKPVILRQAD
jgi:ATP-dependent RNA helicase DeaD